jgi:Cof subfamily protein (haloacid dehalogenase superfamily)
VTPPRLRLVATDLDGTIVPWGGEISDRTVRALQAVERQGVPVVFVTGRPPRWMSEVAERTGHTGLAVCANGALVYDLHSEEVVEHFPLSVEVGLDLARRLREALPELGFAVETLDGFAHEPSYVPRWDRVDARLVAPIEDIYAARPVVKLLARHEQLDADALLAKAREVVGDLAELTHSSTSGLLEISATGVSKATTLARLCEQRGVGADEVVAFGDMPNDLPMLAWAGTAYAMAGGHPDVLAAVERHALSPEEDGVAAVLEELFDLSREPVLDS